MPADDPADQQAARAIEASLRSTVERLERPRVELEWFLSLPKRVRRSARLIEAAQAEGRVLLDHIRAEWAKTRQAQRDSEERLARAKAQPRDLECLRAPDPAAWNGLGRRKKRGRAFNAVGRAFQTRQHISGTAPTSQAAERDVHSLDSSSFMAPTRPPTPPGLLVALANVPGLLGSAMIKHNYGLNTPATPPSPVSPPSPSPPTVLSPPAYPVSLPPGGLIVAGKEVDKDCAYIVARGRHAWAPDQGYTLRAAAGDVYTAEALAPGLLGRLAQLLFPGGIKCHDRAVDSSGLEAVVDFCRGWYELAA